jgi:2-dehydro-3-deoxygalactonokinase
VRAEARSDDGMGTWRGTRSNRRSCRLVEPWLGAGPMDVLACGMVGSRQGWAEAPYVAVPASPAALSPVRSPRRIRACACRDPARPETGRPPDVMRGEETQIAGFLAAAPGFDGVLCLPGTHAKWVQISAGEVVSFRTFMTGELFDLLSRNRSCATRSPGGIGRGRLSRGRVRHAVAARDAGAAAVLHPGGAAAGRDKRRRSRARLSGYLIGRNWPPRGPTGWVRRWSSRARPPCGGLCHALATQGVTARTAMPTR